MIIVTHDNDFATKTHRIIEMEDGKITSDINKKVNKTKIPLNFSKDT